VLELRSTGVCERGEAVRPEAINERPRFTEGSREGVEGPKAASVWCDGLRACANGDGVAAAVTQGSANHTSYIIRHE
jgi:hypothetical protein